MAYEVLILIFVYQISEEKNVNCKLSVAFRLSILDNTCSRVVFADINVPVIIYIALLSHTFTWLYSVDYPPI